MIVNISVDEEGNTKPNISTMVVNEVTNRDGHQSEEPKVYTQVGEGSEERASVRKENNEIIITVANKNTDTFDLALRKFITKVNDNAPSIDREPILNLASLGALNRSGTANYYHTKNALTVEKGDIVTYTIRVYNEGNSHGYATVIEDDIPDGLEFVEDNEINKQYKWKMINDKNQITEDINEAIKIWTPYLSKERGGESNLIKAFDEETMDVPDYKDIQVVFKVTEPKSKDRIVENKAQIVEARDYDNKSAKDIDSTPNVWIDGEDDQDTEKVRVKYFDLSLSKYATKTIVIRNGKEEVVNTGNGQEKEKIAKVDIKTSEIEDVVVKLEYLIKVTNEGEIPGYAKEITDYIPEGLKFIAEDNPLWKENNGKATTESLADTLLMPGESAEVAIKLTWINDENNMGLKTNIAEISKDSNEYNTPDIDSTPNNMNLDEDDTDDSQIMITTTTGQIVMYIVLTVTVLGILVVGIIVVKKVLVK